MTSRLSPALPSGYSNKALGRARCREEEKGAVAPSRQSHGGTQVQGLAWSLEHVPISPRHSLSPISPLPGHIWPEPTRDPAVRL